MLICGFTGPASLSVQPPPRAADAILVRYANSWADDGQLRKPGTGASQPRPPAPVPAAPARPASPPRPPPLPRPPRGNVELSTTVV